MTCAVIITYNEEGILDQCLKALDFVDTILVVDSFSTDKTIDIAKKHNAVVAQRKFDNYASQRNAALKQVPSNCDWILMVDADEIVTPELQTEVLQAVTKNDDITMYRVRRKDMFQGKWIKHSSGYPTWFPRLFKNGCVTVEREINEEYITTGKESQLKEHLIHYPFNKGLSWWFDKHNRYSQMEAEKMLKEMSEPVGYSNLFSKNAVARRKAQKRFSYRLPFRPQFIFLAFYILKKGFLDGKAGYKYCLLRKSYEWMIKVKYNELQKKQFSQTDKTSAKQNTALTSRF